MNTHPPLTASAQTPRCGERASTATAAGCERDGCTRPDCTSTNRICPDCTLLDGTRPNRTRPIARGPLQLLRAWVHAAAHLALLRKVGTGVPGTIFLSAVLVLPPVTLARPVEIRAKLVTGGTFSGKVQGWDGTSLRGTFGQRAWTDLAPADLKRIFLQLMDRTNSAQWLALAELLASTPAGEPLSADVFRQATNHGASAEDLAAARARAQAARDAEAARTAADSSRRLQTGAAAQPPAPWPTVSQADRDQANATTRQRAREALSILASAQDPVETRSFIVASDLPPEETARLATSLEAAIQLELRLLGLPDDSAPFASKPLVVLCRTEDSYKVAQAALFKHPAPAGQRADLILTGPDVALSAWRGSDLRQMTADLLRQTALGVLYRTRSPAPLPPWLASGIADWVAATSVADSPVDGQRRAPALQFLRQGGNVLAVMASTPEAGTWPGPQGVGPAVGYLLVELLMAERPQQFGPWVLMLKEGQPFDQALRTVYGTDAANVASGAVAWYRTNDGGPPANPQPNTPKLPRQRTPGR